MFLFSTQYFCYLYELPEISIARAKSRAFSSTALYANFNVDIRTEFSLNCHELCTVNGEDRRRRVTTKFSVGKTTHGRIFTLRRNTAVNKWVFKQTQSANIYWFIHFDGSWQNWFEHTGFVFFTHFFAQPVKLVKALFSLCFNVLIFCQFTQTRQTHEWRCCVT